MLVVWKIDVFINSFWLYLTFTEMWEDAVHLGIPLKVIPTKESPLKQSRLFNAYHIYSRQVCQLQSNWPFQYGPVIKLPLQILQSIHGQPYGNCCWALINLTILAQHFQKFFFGKFITGPYWNAYPKLLTWALTIQNSAFSVVLDCSISH